MSLELSDTIVYPLSGVGVIFDPQQVVGPYPTNHTVDFEGFVPPDSGVYVTKYVPYKALMSIA